MGIYTLVLENGEKVITEASNPTEAKLKYYSSDYHFKTELFVAKVMEYTDVSKAAKSIRKALLN